MRTYFDVWMSPDEVVEFSQSRLKSEHIVGVHESALFWMRPTQASANSSRNYRGFIAADPSRIQTAQDGQLLGVEPEYLNRFWYCTRHEELRGVRMGRLFSLTYEGYGERSPLAGALIEHSTKPIVAMALHEWIHDMMRSRGREIRRM